MAARDRDSENNRRFQTPLTRERRSTPKLLSTLVDGEQTDKIAQMDFLEKSIPIRSSEPRSIENRFDLDVTIAGWVPLIHRKADWPAFLKEANLRERAALGFLFKYSGNPTVERDSNPNPPTMDVDRFSKLIDSRNFRCAIRVQNIRTVQDDEVRVMEVKLDYFARSGYTPFRILDEPEIVLFSEGVASEVLAMPWVPPSGELGKDIIEVSFAFRLGRKPDMLGRLVGGHWAPWAWISILLELREDGHAAVAWKGSAFPSASLYVNEVKPSTYDVRGAKLDEIRKFINTTGRDDLAPQRLEEEVWFELGKMSID
jgi:hypothetical protein